MTNLKTISTYLTPDFYRLLKLLAATHNVSVSKYIREAIEARVKKDTTDAGQPKLSAAIAA